MLDPRLAAAYKTAETVRFLVGYWSSHAPPRMIKEGQSLLPFMAAEYAPVMLGMARPVARQGMINQWLARLLGEGPISQTAMGLLEQHWAKPIMPSLSLPQLSIKNVRGDAFADALNQIRMQYGQQPLPIGSFAQR